MKSLLLIVTAFLSLFSTTFAQIEVNEESVKAIVEKGVGLITQKGDPALEEINKTDGEFISGSLYAFVYDTEVTIVAHPFKNQIVGKNYKGKADIKGKNFRDDIVNNTLANGAAWTDYIYQKPGDKGLHKKKVYSKLAVTPDGKKYIVCAGMYANE